MARVTAAEVRVILPVGTTLTDPQIDAAIAAAHVMTNHMAASSCGQGLAEDELEVIELYLAAHFAAATENTLSLSSEKDGCCGGSVTYGFKFGEGIKGTPFGQMANTLSGGCLAEFDKQPAGLFSIGSH